MNRLELQRDRIIRLIYLVIGLIVRPFVGIKPNRIMCCSFNFRKYACNPREITQYLLEHHEGEFEIYWAFKDGAKTGDIPDSVQIVKKNSIQYLIALYSSHFIFNNMRNDVADTYFIKKKGQIYVMTWHGSMSLKKVEKDAAETLGTKYVNKAKADSQMCDAMISGCDFHTNLFRNSFWYEGEILNIGTPRCDSLFEKSSVFKKTVNTVYGISGAFVVLYAPTFRSDYSLENYKLEWEDVLNGLREKFGRRVVVLLRMHPNFSMIPGFNLDKYTSDDIIDVTDYPDMQALLCASDILITDYSSAVFDISLIKKPCFIYATDADKYDRGFYFNLNELPYPLSCSNEELTDRLVNFDMKSYISKLDDFYTKRIGNFEDGKSCERLYEWMKQKM